MDLQQDLVSGGEAEMVLSKQIAGGIQGKQATALIQSRVSIPDRSEHVASQDLPSVGDQVEAGQDLSSIGEQEEALVQSSKAKKQRKDHRKKGLHAGPSGQFS